MSQIKNTTSNPLVQGIKIIGVGKHGSKPLPDELVEEILLYLRNADTVPIQKGAFFGALMAKEPTEKERKLLDPDGFGTPLSVEELYEHLCPESPEGMRAIGLKLLRKEHLTKSEARQLGNYLYSDLPGETFRGMAVSMLRIRYETDEEYHGLMEAAEATFRSAFQESLPAPKNSIQLAEPFDGVEHSYLITPLLAETFRKEGHKVVVSLGRSSGPKLSLDVLDLYQGLEGSFLKGVQEFHKDSPRFGWALDQKTLSPALDQWVDRRRLIFKRPFLATLEKVFNPCKAEILITSVFHITYMEKMIRLADMAGFKGIIVLKRGLEGTLAPSIAKASGILCAARKADGSFTTQTFDATDEVYTAFRSEADENIDPLDLKQNIQLIKKYAEHGRSGNEDFDKRVQLAQKLYLKGIDWIKANLPA